MNNILKKNFWLKSTAFILAFMLILPFFAFGGLFAPSISAKAEEETEFIPTSLNLSNGDFENASGSFPSDPTSWTLNVAEGENKGSTVVGVIDYTTFNNTDTIRDSKLSSYPEYDGKLPQSPFGPNPGQMKGNTKFLMINTTPATTTAISYTSSNVSMAANKFYQVTAWVKTGEFTENTGASIRLSGLDGNYAFNEINTVENLAKNNDGLPDLANDYFMGRVMYGWRPYTFYIATSPLKTSSVSVNVGIGDYFNNQSTLIPEEDRYTANFASGYAFFDEVSAYEISATDFNDFSKSDSYDPDYNKIIDLRLESAFADNTEANRFAFGSDVNQNWSNESINNQNVIFATVSADSDLGDDNLYNLENNPVSSTGRRNNDPMLNNILLISSYSKISDTYHSVAAIRKSPKLTIERLQYYRLSFWVKTDQVKDGSGAAAVLTTNKLMSSSNDEFITFTISNMTGDSSNNARYGWKEYAFYIQGSSLRDYEVELELSLGREGTPAKGTAMFHNVRFDKIAESQFSESSSSGTIANFDDSLLAVDTGVSNGNFFFAGDFTDYEFPLAPKSWTFIDAATANTTNYSNNSDHVDDTEILHGIVPIDTAHFNSQQALGSYDGHMLINYGAEKSHIGNMLVLSSQNPTAIGYRSDSINVPTGVNQKITIRMRTDLIDGYGASLVLKSETSILATIEKITTTVNNGIIGFEDFSFYVNGKDSDTPVTVEIWLGMLDRTNNNTKLSSGNIYVASVKSEAAPTGEEFKVMKAAYNEVRSLNRLPKFATYDFTEEDLSAYDYYDSSFIKYPYNWTMISQNNSTSGAPRYGIFDSSNIPANQTQIPSSFKNINPVNNGVLVLQNNSPDASMVMLRGGFSLAATSYYKISVGLKVKLSADNPDTAYGASIMLTGTDIIFENIKDTTDELDVVNGSEAFKTFTFYIATGADSQTSSLAILLGHSNFTDQYCTGILYVNSVGFEVIDKDIFKEMTTDISEKEKAYTQKIDWSVPTEETPEADADGEGSFNWWLIPSILGSTAMLLALLGIVVRKVSDSIAQKTHKKYENSGTYARSDADRFESRAKDIKIRNADLAYEEFDDVLPPAPYKLKKKPVKKVDTDMAEFDDEPIEATEEMQTETAATETAVTDSEAVETDVEQAAATTEKVKAVDPYLDEFDD